MHKLNLQSRVVFILFAGGVAFSTYLCMYAFRKPFTVGTFELLDWSFSVDFKTCLILAQVFGYALSKFIGIKIVSEMAPGKRALTLICLIVLAQLALLLLPLLPQPYNVLALFLNGLPLGMVWGIVFSFLEGRRETEALGAILCACFIFGSGVVKSVGKWLLLEMNVPELWMPFVTGALFLVPFLLSVWALTLISPPNEYDIAQRCPRRPMTRDQRRAFFTNYWPGLVLLIIVYTMLSALRDFSDNFSAEIWISLGYGNVPSIFTTTSLPISVLVLFVMFSLMAIRSNHTAFRVNHFIIGLGAMLLTISTMLYQVQLVSGLVWFVMLNTGLYMAYIPFNCILFDRLIAYTSSVANTGFLIYLADSYGYLASVQILLYKSLFQPSLEWVAFTQGVSLWAGIACVLLLLLSLLYFERKHQNSSDRASVVLA